MRFWNLTLEGAPNGGWTSHAGGRMDPGAPLFELDVSTASQDTAGTCGYVQIWGQPISVLKASQGFYGKKYSLSVGMAAGLPIATQQASEAGQILGGSDTIVGVYSEFQGLTQYLGLNLGGFPASKQTPPPNTSSNQVPPRNLTLNWGKGQPLAQALMQALQSAYPEMTATVNISSKLVAPQTNVGFYETMAEFNTYLRAASRAILGPNMPQYGGVNVVMGNGKINVHDQTQPPGGKQIQFIDLIGQPTFIARNQIQVKVVMRGDLSIGDSITLPVNTILNVAGNLGAGADLTVTGSWVISSLRWVGNSRNPDGNAWCTIIEANQAPSEGSGGGGGGGESGGDTGSTSSGSWSEGAVPGTSGGNAPALT